MKVFYGDNTIEVPKNSNFSASKFEILKKDNKLAKSF